MPLDAIEDDPFEKFNTNESLILFPVTTRKVLWETKQGERLPIDTHKAVVRVMPDGEPHVLNVVGDRYRLVPNKELFNRVESTMRKQITSDKLRDVVVKDRVSGFGRICLREYVFPSIKCTIGGGAKSDIGFRMIVQNGYGGSALRVHAGAIEFYCTNGIIRGEYNAVYHKHTAGLDVAGIDHVVDKSLMTFVDSQEIWRKWANKPVPHEKAMQLFRDLASSDKMKDNLSNHYLHEQETRGPNLWAVYSTLTYYASHSDSGFEMRKTVEEQNTEAITMLKRELAVADWVKTDAWKELESA